MLKRMELILSKNNEYCNGNKDHDVLVLESIITYLTEMIQNPKDTTTFSLHETTSSFSPSTSW